MHDRAIQFSKKWIHFLEARLFHPSPTAITAREGAICLQIHSLDLAPQSLDAALYAPSRLRTV
jgi:hypothetical protein